MIVSKLAGAAMLVSVNAAPMIAPDGPAARSLPFQQKSAVMQTLMRAATECIARVVAANPRFRKQAPATGLGDLIVQSVPQCTTPLRAMIDAHDRFFGDGTGDAFFIGPYLDALPASVNAIAVERAGTD